MEEVSGAVAEEFQGEVSEAAAYCLRLATLHEDMHGEAFCYMRQGLGYAAPALSLAPPPGGGSHAGDAAVPGGLFPLGAAEDCPHFVFDNEKWAHPVPVADFAIAKAPVTQGQFLEFVRAGGYRDEALWSFPGWVWRCRRDAELPIYWRRSADGEYVRRDFDREVPIEPDRPVVHVNYFEAEAFCRFVGRRLPTEAEWEMAASLDPATGHKRRYPWGDAAADDRANLSLQFAGCADVAAFPAGDSAAGCRQMLGNVWEWTASAFYPYPGYVVDAPYREYSAPWFGDRMVLRGGAFATPERMVHNTWRNFFPPDRRDVFAGFRTCAV